MESKESKRGPSHQAIKMFRDTDYGQNGALERKMREKVTVGNMLNEKFRSYVESGNLGYDIDFKTQAL